MLKGKLTIDLHNHRSGFTERYEEENMVTNAITELVNGVSSSNQSEAQMFHNSLDDTEFSYKVFPIALQGLGGLLLFDSPLDERPDNILLPSNSHLVGYADNYVNSTSTLKGSRNNIESRRIENGYTTVWDFSTSQCNSMISSIARTSGMMASPLIPMDTRIFSCNRIKRLSYHNSNTRETEYMSRLIKYDNDKKLLTVCTTAYNIGLCLYTFYAPLHNYGVTDYSNQFEVVDSKILADFQNPSGSYSTWNVYMILHYLQSTLIMQNGFDGYGYIPHVYYDSIRNKYHIGYYTIKTSDDSFELDDVEKGFDIDDAQNALGWNFSASSVIPSPIIIVGGKIYVFSDKYSDKNRNFRIYELDNPSVYHDYQIPDGFYFEEPYQNNSTLVYPSGVLFVIVRYYAGNIFGALIYPDGTVIIDTYDGLNTIYGRGCIIENTNCISGSYSDQRTIFYPHKYIGTICNLSSPVTKTPETSMKISYTLTDV